MTFVYTYNYILNTGGQLEPLLARVLLFYKLFLPKSTDSDYIEDKTKFGGLTKIKSITQNSIIIYLIKWVSSRKSRPHVICDDAINLTLTKC